MKTALDHAELDADQLHTIETRDFHGSLCGENGLDQAEHDAGQLRTSETRDFRGSLCETASTTRNLTLTNKLQIAT